MTKKTPLYYNHIHLGAKMVEFAGYEMPLQYTGVLDEHHAVRKQAGLFDVSHMGEIWIKGKHALDLIQYISTNDASVLKPGDAQYSCMPNGKGGIVDDIIVYCYSDEKYFLVVNAANMQKDWEWIVSNNKAGAELENSSDTISQIAIQGPAATEILKKLTSYNLDAIPYFKFIETDVAGIQHVIVSNTGYTGAGGFELYVYNQDAAKLWDALLNAGKEEGIKPCGLACRDTLRLEKGYCLYGNEIDDATSPMEAGLAWIVKLNKDADFVDKSDMQLKKAEGLSRTLVGFEMIDKGIPRHGYEIADLKGNIMGIVTSGTMSPTLNKAIGIGYVSTQESAKENVINILIRNKSLKAKVVALPFL